MTPRSSSISNLSSGLEDLDGNIYNLCRLVACLDCQLVPVDLFLRAGRSKLAWAANGELEQTSPASASVPIWLLNLLYPKAVVSDSLEQTWLSPAHELGIIELISQCGVHHLRLATNSKAQICAELNQSDRRELLSAWLSICIHAFPGRYVEISGAEMEMRFLGTIESSILPLLAVITDEDIMDWVAPKSK